ncbi:MAG: hypothetical protein NTZ74_05205 [Chloroflexi bacterium]|nr:hypothetical protein [Chloroflexota bacterium]
MYKIVYDQNNYIKDERMKRIDSYISFPDAYKLIIDLNQNALTETIFVGNATIYHWLRILASRYPQGTFVFEAIDARSVLA